MGFKYSYSVEDLSNAVRTFNAIKHDACDKYNDGYIQFGAKQDLWRLKWILDQTLKDCPTFSLEEDWLREQEKKQVIRILKDEV